MRPPTKAEWWARLWVHRYWADQMRKGNAPDLPDTVTVEQFDTYSHQLADKIGSKP